MISEIGTRSYRVEGGYAPVPGQAANQEFQTICNFPAIVHFQAARNGWIINREGQ